MARESRYFSLSLESLRALGSWAAELRCDDRANDGSLRDTMIYVLLAEDFQTDSMS